MQNGEPANIIECQSSEARPKAMRMTKDVVVVGWINPAGVTLSTTNVSSGVLDFYPENGLIESKIQKGLTLAHLGYLAYIGNIHPIWPWRLNTEERRYILNWLFKYGSNHEPPHEFASEAALMKFVRVRTNFKLFNRFRIGFFVYTDTEQLAPDDLFLYESETGVGVTTEPIFGMKVPGEEGPLNGRYLVKKYYCYQINDGTPDTKAVKAFHTLIEGGLKWSHIGSMIEHRISVISSYQVKMQVYPTYYIYDRQEDGEPFRRVRVVPQASEPSMNFYSDPYPPGPAPFVPDELRRNLH